MHIIEVILVNPMKLVLRTFRLGLLIALAGTLGLSQSDPKPRVFVIESNTWSAGRTFPGSLGDFLIGARGGGSPQTAEIIKTFGERCKESIVNISREKADYIVLLEHEGGKGLLRVDNKFAIFDPAGDAIESGSTRALGNSVDDACTALKKDWKDRKYGRLPPKPRVAPSPTPRPITSLDLRGAGGTDSTSAVTFLSTPDGSEIEIDGKFTGNTPSLLQLKVGDHEVTVKRTGYRPWQKTISVIPGGNILVSAELETDVPVPQPPTPATSSPPALTVPGQAANVPPGASAASAGVGSNPNKGRTGAAGIEFVWIPPGEYIMGSTDGEKYEKPVRKVTISEGFWLGRYEVTQLQWFSEMGLNPSEFAKCGGNCPVENVSWDDTQLFIAKLNAKADGFVYSLPTEAQWEYAARAGSPGKYAGDVDSMAWHRSNSGGTTRPVGTKQPNAWGLYDMHGNAWEWCEDWYGDYQITNLIDPKGAPRGNRRVLRGGAWIDAPTDARSSFRGKWEPSARFKAFGLRVVAQERK